MMRKIIDATLFYIAVGFGMFAAAQAPQIPLTGTAGPGGNFSFRNASPVSMTADANHTMVYPEGSGAFVKVTSTVSLSATRNLIEPFLTNAQCFENATTGGQAIQVIGASGTGVTIPNGSYACVQGDGTNYHAPNVSDLPFSAPSFVSGTPSAGALAALPSGAHGLAGDESSTAGVPAAGVDYWRWDSTSHCAKGSFNGTAESCAATLLTFAAPPAIGDTTPAPSVAARYLRVPVLADPGGIVGAATYTTDTLNGYAEVHEGTAALSRICTAANGVCGGGGGVTQIIAGTNVTISPSGGTGAVTVNSGAAGSNVSTIILAASNSTALQKSQANTVCPGTNDDACIQTALDTACPANTTGQVNGGRVVLKAGIYNASATIHQRGNSCTLEGEEEATWGGYRHGSGFTGGGCTTGSPCGDLATGGSQIRSASNYGPIIEWDATPTPACGPTDSLRSCGLVDRNLYLVGFQYLNEGISGGGQADMSEVDDVMIQRASNCLDLNTDSGVATKVRCQDDAALGAFGGEHSKFRDSLIFDVNGSCGIFGATIVTGNTFGDCAGITDSSPFEIVGNDFYRIFCGSIWFQGSGYGGAIAGNNFDNSDAGCSSAANWIQVNPDGTTGYGAFAISGNSAQTGHTFGQGGYFVDAGADNGASVTGNSIFGGFNGGGSAYNVAATGVSAGNAPGFSGGALYNNSTAYIIGDYVTYGANGLKYICIANSTGNLPTNGSFWTQLSSGTVPLAAWYKGETIQSGGSGTAITSWPDSSGWPNRQMTVGTGTTLYESSSTVDSLPGARFAGTSYLQETEIQFSQTTAKTIFIAVHPTSISGGAHEAMFSGGTVLTPYVAYDGFGNVSANCCGGGGTFGSVSSGTQILEYNLTNPMRISTSGTLTSLTGGTNFAGVWPSPMTMWLGETNYDGTGPEFPFSGDIADVMVFNGSMSNADAAIIGAALCSKYSVTCGTNW